MRRWTLIAAAAYAAGLALWVAGAGETRAWCCAVVAMVLAAWAAERSSDAARWAAWGLAIVVASAGTDEPSRALGACGAVGAFACACAGIVAIARVSAAAGLVAAATMSPWPGVVVMATAWGVAIATPISPMSATVAAAASTIVLLAATAITARRRRLELGVGERTTAAAIACVAGALLLAMADGRAGARLSFAIAASLVTAASVARDAVRVARIVRRAVVVAIAGGGLALLGASVAEGRAGGGGGAWIATLVTAAIALGIGAAAPALEAPLRPARGAWLDAFARASSHATHGDPDDSIRSVLRALRAAGGPGSPSPELWTLAPSRVCAVDGAGYLHEHDADLPEPLVMMAAGEPEATLRAGVLDALQVRRPELRPLAKWMTDRGALLATVVACDGEAEGLLVVPRAPRDGPPTLEEVRALKEVADRVAAAIRARAERARLLDRAHQATLRTEAAEEDALRLRHDRQLDVGRHALATTRLARPATVGIYSAASRLALDALERRTAAGAPVAVVAASGVDPVPYLARAHLAGTRKDEPLVLVDATIAREHDPARWTDKNASPLALADRGMLVLLDGAALPADVQRLVARSLAEKRAPWQRPDPLDVQLAFTATAAPADLVESGRLDVQLAARLGDARSSPVELPRLRDRAEDLRAILTDRLAREGLRVRSRPVGIEKAAYARLVEYAFPGEDAELSSIVQRLVARCNGDLVRAEDVEALSLASREPPA